MKVTDIESELLRQYLSSPSHQDRDYFSLIKELVKLREEHHPSSQAYLLFQEKIDQVYDQICDEIKTNNSAPISPVNFGTSGWRGIIGKDLFVKSVSIVTQAIACMYEQLAAHASLSALLGVSSLKEAQNRGCVLGFDNRFGNEILAQQIIKILTAKGFTVHYAHEATTGTLSAAVLQLGAAFSINLTPSHNPLEYGGFKFNAADAGPAAPEITNWITNRANAMMQEGYHDAWQSDLSLVNPINALALWTALVRNGVTRHGLDYEQIIAQFSDNERIAVAIDCVHGASRIHVAAFFKNLTSERLIFLRKKDDPTFGGIAPEPSTVNLQLVTSALQNRREPLKLGVIMDPDADRIRFTDGTTEINMNQFGAMAYHFLHEHKQKKGLVAKTVATSNFANAIAKALHEEVFEPRVGFKEFKPVVEKALVCFEESDGISIIGHTPEKDAYIGLLLALDMVMTLDQNLGDYLRELQESYGAYFPDKDGVAVSQNGESLSRTLQRLAKYLPGTILQVGRHERTIREVISIDGFKFILDDDSWLMIRPSGTEPKVRFYVEARTDEAKTDLFTTAKYLLKELELL